MCRGTGHEYYECPTKKALDKLAKQNNDRVLWGYVKWFRYAKALGEEGREHGKKLSKRANASASSTGYKRKRY